MDAAAEPLFRGATFVWGRGLSETAAKLRLIEDMGMMRKAMLLAALPLAMASDVAICPGEGPRYGDVRLQHCRERAIAQHRHSAQHCHGGASPPALFVLPSPARLLRPSFL